MHVPAQVDPPEAEAEQVWAPEACKGQVYSASYQEEEEEEED